MKTKSYVQSRSGGSGNGRVAATGFYARVFGVVVLIMGLVVLGGAGVTSAHAAGSHEGAAEAAGGGAATKVADRGGSNPSPDREYVLEAFLDGYVGLEGEIEGQTNPVLTAAAGETVRIRIVNGESMPHDIVMERHGASSEIINRRGAETEVTFTAETDDYYFCSVGSHRQAGMEGRFEIE